MIGSFSNANNFTVRHDEHFTISNSFQTGNLILQFQGTDGSLNNVPDYGNPGSHNPQRLISNQSPKRTFGTVVLTIEFVKYGK